jgi:hypothetical protein
MRAPGDKARSSAGIDHIESWLHIFRANAMLGRAGACARNARGHQGAICGLAEEPPIGPADGLVPCNPHVDSAWNDDVAECQLNRATSEPAAWSAPRVAR